MEAKHRYAPLIDEIRIDFAIALLVGNHFAAALDGDEGPVNVAALLLERLAVALGHIMKHPHARHVPPAIDLDMVPAQKLILPVVFPPGYVNVHATRSIVVVWRNPGELGEVSHHPARRRIHHIAAYHARRAAAP